MIEWQNVCKSYICGNGYEHKVLENVCLRIAEHDFVGVLGRSGSGKSTALYMLGLLDFAAQGQYLLHGKDVALLNNTELAELRNKLIGFIFQQFVLLPNLTVAENVALPLTYSAKSKPDWPTYVEKVLRCVDMLDFIDQVPNQLSGGQQQRVAIARALVCEPKILLADEPTGSLDSENGQQIINLFGKINRDFGTTIVMVTHDQLWAKYCSRVFQVAKGNIK